IWGHRPEVTLVELVTKEQDLRGTIGYYFSHEPTIELVASGKVDLKPFITHKIALDRPFRKLPVRWRSEEHTSELQSRFDLVFRLSSGALLSPYPTLFRSIWGHRPEVTLVELVTKEQDLRGTIGYYFSHEPTIELVASGKVDLKPFITHKIALDRPFRKLPVRW